MPSDVVGGESTPRRLRRARDVRRVLTEGRRWQDRLLALRARPHPDEAGVWLAILVPRMGRRATVRNRVKRWIREDLRAILGSEPIIGGWWLAVIPRSAAATSPHQALRASLHRLLGQAGVVQAAGAPGASE